MDRKRQRTPRLVVWLGLAVAIAVTFSVLFRREAREIVGSTEESAGDAAQGPPTVLAPRLRVRDPVAAPEAAVAEADRPPEVARDPVPEGGLRIVLHTPGRQRRDGTAVAVNVVRTGGGGTSFAFSPDLKDNPLTPAPMASLGRDASLRLEGGWEASDEASLLLLGLAPGTYAVFARLLNRRPEVVAGAEVTVAPEHRASVRLELDPKRPEARVSVRVRRAGEGVAASVKVVLGDLTLEALDPEDETRSSTIVPAGVDLELAVDRFPGHRLFGLLPRQRVRVAPGASEVVTFDLPEGVLVTIGPADWDGEGRIDVSLWRHADPEPPQYVEDALVLTLDDLSVATARVPPGRYTATTVTTAGRGWETFEVVPPGPVHVRIRTAPERGGRLRLRWTEADGTPPPPRLSAVLIREDVVQLDRTWSAHRTADAAGIMEWRLPAAGTYGVYCWDRKLYRRIVVADDADRDLDLRMPRAIAAGGGVTLRGRVTLPDGAGANGFTVLFEPDGSEWATLGDTAGGGDLKLEGLVPGTGRLRVPWSPYRIGPPSAPYVQSIRLFADRDNRIDIELRAP